MNEFEDVLKGLTAGIAKLYIANIKWFAMTNPDAFVATGSRIVQYVPNSPGDIFTVTLMLESDHVKILVPHGSSERVLIDGSEELMKFVREKLNGD